MSFSETAPRHGIFSGCCFYVQVCNRSSLAVAEDVRFLRMCGGEILHHPLSDKATHYVVGLPATAGECRDYKHKIKGRGRMPGLGKDFTLDDLVRVALSCQGQITVVQSAWILECMKRGRILGPVEDCGGWLVKAVKETDFQAPFDDCIDKPADAQSVPPTAAPSLTPPPCAETKTPETGPERTPHSSTPPTSPSSRSLFSPQPFPLSPPTQSVCKAAVPALDLGDSSLPSPLPSSLSLASPLTAPVSPLTAPVSPLTASANLPSAASSSAPTFLKVTSHRDRHRPLITNKKIPNTAWVRNTTVGELPVMVEKKRRRASSTAVGLKKAPLSITMPKRARPDLSKMKFTKLSRHALDPSPQSSRDSSPEVPLSETVKQACRPPGNTVHLQASSAHNLFCFPDGHPLRFYLHDAADTQTERSILDHGGELAPQWDSTLAVCNSSAEARGIRRSLYGVKGAVTSCPLIVASQWIKASLSAGKLLPIKPYTL